MKNKIFTIIVLTVAIYVSSVIIGVGQTPCPTPVTTPAAGSLDTTFSPDCSGKVIAQPLPANNPLHRKSVRQSDNKIVTLANASDSGNTFRNVIIRFNPDGSLDSSFGNGGFVYVNWNSSGSANSIAIQQVAGEERLVIAGGTVCGQNSCLRAERYTSTGVRDSTFGTNGVTSLTTGAPNAVAIQPADQKILMIDSDGILVRLNANGTTDSAFGKNGISQAKPGVNAQALGIQSNGRIITVGWSGQSKTDIAVARFNANGTLDDGSRSDSTAGDLFGTAGKATADFAGKSDWGYDVAIDESNRIIVVGQTQITGTTVQNGDAALVRFTSAGQLDTSFGTGGKTSLNLSGLQDSFRSIAFQMDGKIIVFGESLIYSGNKDFLVARYNSNGTLDTVFGTNGWVTTDIFGATDFGSTGFTQIDPVCNCEKIIMVGTTNLGAVVPRYIVALRYLL